MSEAMVAICMPCIDKPHLQTAANFAHMMWHLGRGGLSVATIFRGGSLITKARNDCLKHIEEYEAQGSKFSHIMWIDSDMLFPQDIIARLLTHAKPIVGCTYVRRTPPYDCHGKTLDGVAQNVSDAGLLEVAGLPGGCMLVHRDVYKRLPKPYYRLVDEEASDKFPDGITYGEDYYFCAAARAAGFKIWLDTQLSKEIGHISERVLYPDQPGWELPAEDATLEELQSMHLQIQERILAKMPKRAA